ncbi:DUF4446 family protein [Nocardiopsis listeri]|uniref:DUF4446 family protein n=1 Tax=Nocardiopsis listeri TaxID=53440 RepID=UPI00082D6B2F|nr:DUF4446 family protein [Nocardiopsis listeri]
MFTTILALIGLLIGLGGLAVGGYALLRAREAQDEYRTLAKRALAVNATGSDPRTVRDVAVLHYDALEEMTGARSFSLALLNSHGDGVVVTSINGRTETRTYAKVVTRGEPEDQLSPEECRVVRSARLGDGIGATSPEPAREEDDTVLAETEKDLVTVVPEPEKGTEAEETIESGLDGADEARAPEPRTPDSEMTESMTPDFRN